MSNEEREEIITVIMMRKNYSVDFLESQSDEQLRRLLRDIEQNN